jgi:hypothetical protein
MLRHDDVPLLVRCVLREGVGLDEEVVGSNHARIGFPQLPSASPVGTITGLSATTRVRFTDSMLPGVKVE